MPRPPLVISHRTNMGTLPENTITGIEGAIRDGADGIEIDVRATADGEIVLLHDANLDRTTDARGPLAERSLASLDAVRVEPLHAYQQAERIPTLREALAAVNGRALLVIEIKEPDLEARVERLIDEAGAGAWCWIWSFSPAVCEAVASLRPQLPIYLNWGTSQGSVTDAIAQATRLGLAGVSLSHPLVTAAAVSSARDEGLQVATWTLNEVADIERVIAAGVDAICGDVPTAIAGRIGG